MGLLEFLPPLRFPTTSRQTLECVASPGSESEQATRERRWLWLVVVPLAAVLRLLLLSHKSLWLDETLSVFFARRDLAGFFQIMHQGEFNMVLYYALLRVVLHLGDSEFWVRLPAVLAGVAAVPVMWALGKTVFDRRIGLLAALLLAVNSCHVLYSQEARAYSLLVLLSALSSLLFIKGIEKPSAGVWLGYAIVNALAVYSHFFAVLLILAQWLSLLVLPGTLRPWKKMLWGMAGTALLCSPAAFFVLYRNTGQLNWVKKPGFGKVFNTLPFFAAEGAKGYGYVLLLGCLAALVGSGHELWRDGRSESPLQRWRKAMLWFCLAVPIGLVYAASVLRTPMFEHRYLLICLPAFLLLVAQGFAVLRGRWLVPVYVALSLAAVALSYTQKKEDWRATAGAMLSQSRPGDAVCFFPPGTEKPFRYYELRWQERSRALPEGAPAGEASGRAMPAGCAVDVLDREVARLWLVLSPIPAKSSPGAELLRAQADFTARYRLLQENDYRAVRVLLFDTSRPK